MASTQFNKRWHSPVNVFMHLDKLTKEVGIEELEKSPKYKRVKEARIAAIMAFVLSKIRNLPTLIRLVLHDPPDAYLMQPNKGTMDITTVEITSYRPSKETLLEQLIRTKFKLPFPPSNYILLVELLTEDKVYYDAINDYAIKNSVSFPIWTLRKTQQSPDTMAEVVMLNPAVSKRQINVGEEAYFFNNKFNTPHVVYSKKALKAEDIRAENFLDGNNITPWEELED